MLEYKPIQGNKPVLQIHQQGFLRWSWKLEQGLQARPEGWQNSYVGRVGRLRLERARGGKPRLRGTSRSARVNLPWWHKARAERSAGSQRELAMHDIIPTTARASQGMAPVKAGSPQESAQLETLCYYTETHSTSSSLRRSGANTKASNARSQSCLETPGPAPG